MAFVESSTKAGWLSLKALRKQDDFCWMIYKSRMAFVESSTKAGWFSLKGLQKQDGFRWKLYESKIAFIESSSNAGWLSLKALWKPFKKCVNFNITQSRDKIAMLGVLPFVEDPDLSVSAARATSATLKTPLNHCTEMSLWGVTPNQACAGGNDVDLVRFPNTKRTTSKQ